MKHIRSKLALTLCLALSICGASSALAASDEVPSFTLTAPESGVSCGSEGTLTVEAATPGFLTVELLDASGTPVTTLLDFKEVHTQTNDVAFLAEDASGNPLPAGSYTLSATMKSQFGVSSGAVTAGLTVSQPQELAPTDNAPEAPAQTGGEQAAAPAENALAQPAESAPQQPAESAPAQPAESAPAQPAESAPAQPAESAPAQPAESAPAQPAEAAVGYGSGSADVGEEGLQIGVGVSDVAEQADAGYWALSAGASDAEIWAAITRELVGVDVGENESAYIYDSVEKDRSRLGTVSGISQGLNVIAEREDGWSLVEAFRNEDGAFVRGYIRTNKLRRATPNTSYGLVIDKAAQTLTVYKDGARIGSCAVTTGLPTDKYLQRETPAGEFITVTRRGTLEYYGKGFTKYTIRINGGYYLCEIPTTKKNGSDFSLLESSLGGKSTRGSICIAHEASSDGGINAEWIWNMTDENKKVKVLIFDDKDRSQVPVGE